MADTPVEKEGRLARYRRLGAELRHDPKVVVPWTRRWLARLWHSKGGGFYGLGFVVTFVALELRSLTNGVAGGGSASAVVSDFIVQQLIHYVVRFSYESMLNVVWAMLWPIYVLQWLDPLLGLALLGLGYLGFVYFVRPSIETWFPELAQLRSEAASRKAEKRERRRAKRERKRGG